MQHVRAITNALCHIEMIDMKNRTDKVNATFGQVEEGCRTRIPISNDFYGYSQEQVAAISYRESTPEITDQQKVKLFKRS